MQLGENIFINQDEFAFVNDDDDVHCESHLIWYKEHSTFKSPFISQTTPAVAECGVCLWSVR